MSGRVSYITRVNRMETKPLCLTQHRPCLRSKSYSDHFRKLLVKEIMLRQVELKSQW